MAPEKCARVLVMLVLTSLIGALVEAETMPETKLPLRIGADQSGANAFIGTIARARVFKRELTAAEVAALAASKPDAGCADPALLGDWSLGRIQDGVCANSAGPGLAARVVGDVQPVEFDGVKAARLAGQGYLEVAYDPRLNLGDAATVDAWIRPEALSGSGARIVDRISPGGSDGFLLDTFPGNSLRVIVGGDKLSCDAKLKPGEWVHVAATTNADGDLRLYVAGKRVAGAADLSPEEPGGAPPPGNPLTLWYRQPATRWNEANPLGNGRLGAMVWGGVEQELLQLNEDTLWSGEPRELQNREAAKVLPEIRRLLLAGNNAEAQRLADTKLLGAWDEAYLPLSDLVLDFRKTGAAEGYRRDLDLSRGVWRVSYRIGDATFTREVFVSHPDQVIVVRLTCDKPHRLDFAASLRSQLRSRTQAEGSRLLLLGRAPKTLDAYDGNSPIVYGDEGVGKGMRFQTQLQAVPEGGRAEVADTGITVHAANAVTLLCTAATSFNGPHKSPSAEGRDPAPICRGHLDRAAAKPYPALLQAHVADYQRLFGRVSIELPSGPTSGLPTDRFTFYGFPPAKAGRRERLAQSLDESHGTCIFYVPARQVPKFLADLEGACPAWRVVICRELTKMFEEFVSGTPAEALAALAGRTLKGEVTLLAAPPVGGDPVPIDDD